MRPAPLFALRSCFRAVAAMAAATALLAGCEKHNAYPSPGFGKPAAESTASASPAASPASAPNADAARAHELFNQGVNYRNGSGGTPRDLAKALEAFQGASDLGDRDAMFLLGVMYENGESVPVDLQKALELYTKSAELGCGSAPPQLKALREKMANKPSASAN